MRIDGRRALTTFTIALLLQLGLTDVAFARVLFCAGGDIDCLIVSIRSANERPGGDTIILAAGTYTFTVANNAVDIDPLEAVFGGAGNALPSITSRVTIQGAGPT